MNTLLTLLSEAHIRAYTSAGYWQDRTIYSSVRQQAEHFPDRVAVRERLRTTTYGQLLNAADRLAAAWHQAGLRVGDRVAVWLPSRVEIAVAVLACSRRGYVVCPSLHRDHTISEIADLVTRMRAAAVVIEEGYGADADRHDLLERIAGTDHIRFWRQLRPGDSGPILADLADQDRSPAHDDPNSIVYLAYTSGTTGVPKGVMHSDNTLLSPVRALASDWSLDAESRIYSLSPFSHNLGFGAMILALTIGAELIVHDLPRGDSLADRLRQTRASFAFGVPTHAMDLLAEVRSSQAPLPDLRGFRISGAPVPPVVAQDLMQLGIVPQSGYGMTEAGSHHYTRADDDPSLIVGSSGRPCEGYEIKIFDQADHERELPAGEVGQIGGRGASLMLGYFDDQLATETSFNRSGWFLTGDLGWVDEAGYLRITGRKKDLIIRGGHNIFPAKIEALVLRHEVVTRAAVIPVADERLGEKVCLVVESRGDQPVNPAEVLDHLDTLGLSKFDMPEYFAQVPALPLLPSGKVSKRRLTEWIAEGKLQPVPVRFVGPNVRSEGG